MRNLPVLLEKFTVLQISFTANTNVIVNFILPQSHDVKYYIVNFKSQSYGPYNWNEEYYKDVFIFSDSQLPKLPKLKRILISLTARRIIFIDDSFVIDQSGIGLESYKELRLVHTSSIARKIQNAYRQYIMRKRDFAARIIQKACNNWIDKPITNDGKTGISCRIYQRRVDMNTVNTHKRWDELTSNPY